MASDRYYPNNEKEQPAIVPFDELLASLTRINLYSPPVQTCSTGYSFHGFYRGPTSIAYLFFRLASLYPDLSFKGQSLLDWSEAYLVLGENVSHPPIDPSNCGIANEALARLAFRIALEKDPSLAQKLCSYCGIINTQKQTSGQWAYREGSNEWLYGRAGYLYLLRLARSAFENHCTVKLINESIKNTTDRILMSPRPWKWHGKEYLGAAHGDIGILTQLVLSATSPEKLEEHLVKLLETQFPSGNFPSSQSSGDELVQFCHGSPGFAISLLSLHPHFLSLRNRVDKAITASQADVWKRGLLTKMSCLCHGIAGNALALPDEQFAQFLGHMTGDVLERDGWLEEATANDLFAGLYTGEAGRAWVWAVADKKLEKTCIGYNDL